MTRQLFPLLLTLPSLALGEVFHGSLEVTDDGTIANAATELTLTFASDPGISFPSAPNANYGDYDLSLPPGNNDTTGVLLTTISENGSRSGIFATSAPAVGLLSPGRYGISVHQSLPGSTETNADIAFAFFSYADWPGGHALNSTNGGAITSLRGSSITDIALNIAAAPSHFLDHGDGTFTLKLDGNSSQDGILLVNGGKNEDNYALAKAEADGTFSLFLHDNEENGGTYELDPINFVYLPKSRMGTDGLAAMGRGLSDGSTVATASDGPFTLTAASTGTWHLSITGQSPETGTLIVSPEGGDPFNIDNIVTYEWDATNSRYVIQSRDLPNHGLQSGGSGSEPMFSFAFFVSKILVNAAATNGQNTGTSWADAYTSLQDALENAIPGQGIWVAEGSYFPDEGAGQSNGDRNATFALKSGVEIYGGFPASGDPTFADRDPAAHETILSGDLDQNDGEDFANNGENARHVVTADSTDTKARLDGFTITAGNANGVFPDSTGGGFYAISAAAPTVANSRFRGNSANFRGGASGNIDSSPSFLNCSFVANFAAAGGGAIYNIRSDTAVTNCHFLGNASGGGGGAAYNSFSSPIFTNVSFQGNSTTTDGGAMTNDSSAPTLLNCSFQGNSAMTFGGAILNVASSPSLTNTILWANALDGSMTSAGASVSSFNSSPTYSHCLVQNIDLSGANGNLDGTDRANNPRFVAEVDPLAAPVTSGGDLRVFLGSPALDAGLNSANTTIVTDLAGSPRIQGGTIDLGPVEGFVDDPALLWTTDFDGDDRSYGLEITAGTDPETADRDPLFGLSVQSGGLPVFQFTRDAHASENFILKVMRSPDLSPGSFAEVARITRSGSATDTEGGNQFFTSVDNAFVIFGDQTPPFGKSFYRLEAELVE